MDIKDLKNLCHELGKNYDLLKGPKLKLGICGGAALILTRLIERTTTDIDVIFPLVWPIEFQKAVEIITDKYGLSQKWINQGPKDLFTMGLPAGFEDRAQRFQCGSRLTLYLATRIDQIFFKVYASADRAGYHVDDLQKLNPTSKELVLAARWSMTHDTSEAFSGILKSMFEALGYNDVAKQI